MSKNIFFVSGFITNIHKNDKSVQNYIDWAKKTINLNMNIIIFLEKHIYYEYFKEYNNDVIGAFEYENKQKFEYVTFNNIYFVFFEKKDIYLYDYKDNITKFQVITDNPNKDTIDYMFVQCHKTEWIKMSICLMNQKEEIDVTNAELIWIDFGIYHMIKNEELFKQEMCNLTKRLSLNLHNKVRIGGCWGLNKSYDDSIYNKIKWHFAGSLFGGSADKLLEFSNLMKKKCLDIIKERNTFVWEVNIWYLVYLENPELFDYYVCLHDITILKNY